MIDFTSLFIVASILFGMVIGDAALYGDTLRVQIAVAQDLNNAGFTEATAEQIFTAEAARIVSGKSIIPAPPMRIASNPSVVTALAKPLDLDSVVTALQSQLGIDHLVVSGAILTEAGASTAVVEPGAHPLTATRLDMPIVVAKPQQTPVHTVLVEDDGDPVRLVRKGAAWAMEQVAPYRVVLSHFIEGMAGNTKAMARAREAANRLLNRPWDPTTASERAMARHVLALMAMNDGDFAEADAQFAMADRTPDVAPQVRSQLCLDHAFLAVAMKQPQPAADLLRRSHEIGVAPNLPNFAENLALMEGLIAWSGGDTATAEARFRQVIANSPVSDSAHHYLALLLAARGDQQGAAAENKAAALSHPFDQEQEGLAVVLFWTDPIKGGITRRA
jgi:hypothetical protein